MTIAVPTAGVPLRTMIPGATGQATSSWAPATPGFVFQETLSLAPSNWVNSASGVANPVTVTATVPRSFTDCANRRAKRWWDSSRCDE